MSEKEINNTDAEFDNLFADESTDEALETVETVSDDEAETETEKVEEEVETNWKAEAEKWKALSRKNETEKKETFDRLKEIERSSKPEAEQASEELAELRAFKQATERKSLIAEIVETNGFPADAAALLTGKTAEELESNIKAIKAIIGNVKVTPAPVKTVITQGKEQKAPVKISGSDDELADWLENL